MASSAPTPRIRKHLVERGPRLDDDLPRAVVLADRVVVELPGKQLSHLGSAQAAAQARRNPVVQPEVVAGARTLERWLIRTGAHGAAQAREEKEADEAARSHGPKLEHRTG